MTMIIWQSDRDLDRIMDEISDRGSRIGAIFMFVCAAVIIAIEVIR